MSLGIYGKNETVLICIDNFGCLTMTNMISINDRSTRNQSFPFAIEDDPLHRLLDGEKSVQYAESVGQAIGFRWIVGSVGWLTPTTILRQTLAKSSPSIRSGLEQVLTPLLLSPEPHKLLGMDVIGLHLPVHVPHLLVATSESRETPEFGHFIY